MRFLPILFVLSLFVACSLQAADANDAEALDQTISKLESTFKAGDYSYAVEVMYAPFLEAAGGKQAALASMDSVKSQMKAMNVKVITWETKKPYQFASTPKRRYAIVPYRTEMEVNGKKVKQSGYQLAIKEGTAPWQVLNGDTLTPEVYEKFFPDFPKILTLPKLDQTVE